MPQYCAALGCKNLRTAETRQKGITFHRFPTEREQKQIWEKALRRDGFAATRTSVLCSEHFREEQMDRTGQIVRLRDGAFPSVFTFPEHIQEQPVAPESPATLTPPATVLEVEVTVKDNGPKIASPNEHSYALPSSPECLKDKLASAQARVLTLERELRNVRDRERRCKSTLRSVLEELKGLNLVNEELKQKCDLYSDIPLDLVANHGHGFSQKQREFAITLHLHGPKAYRYLRDTMHLPLPHPHTLQKWMKSVDVESDSCVDV